MIGDIVKNVGGERVQVEESMGPWIDPHLYRASEGDLHALEKSDVIFLQRPAFRGRHRFCV
jgi:manganese/zinc/iron transport system substrate-binding protein